jgi:hypothetical protein
MSTSRSRWLDWKPKTQNSFAGASMAPSKPSKINLAGLKEPSNSQKSNFEGFEGFPLPLPQKFEAAQTRAELEHATGC